jgi:hypothetical protein
MPEEHTPEKQPVEPIPEKGNISKTLKKINKIRPRKLHLDYITGLLSIPVLLTAILLNFGNITGKNKEEKPSPTPNVIVVSEDKDKDENIVTPAPVCKKEIGPISIDYPEEGDTVSENPLTIPISYSDENYCSVVWSYRINDGPWSSYNNTSPSLFNLPSGNVKFQLRVNSTVTDETETITRNFTYIGGPTPTSGTASQSAATN